MPKSNIDQDQQSPSTRRRPKMANLPSGRRDESEFRRPEKKISVDSEELKRIVAGCKENGLKRAEISVVVKKWKRREFRRLSRQNEKQRKRVCFNCRKPGHQLVDCPEVLGTRDFAVGVCFKCGSTEHSVAECRLKIKNFPYAKCFVCGETGHLSRNCESNPNGAFPEGGSCKLCGATNHMKKDCPTLANESVSKTVNNGVALSRLDGMKSADDDSCTYLIDTDPSPGSTSKKNRSKVVRF